MKRTSFVCFGAEGSKDALVYQEVPGREGGEEFFLFFSPGEPGQEALLRSLFRDAVSTSRLGVATNYFQNFIERFREAALSSGETDDPLAGALLVIEIRRGDEVYLLCNRGDAIAHWQGGREGFGGIDSIPGVEELPLGSSGDQQDLFRRAPQDFFVLRRFELPRGIHTLIVAPSNDFLERHIEAFREKILGPSFEPPQETGIAVDAPRSFPALHWRKDEAVSRPSRIASAGTGTTRRVPAVIAISAVAVTAALIVILGHNGRERQVPSNPARPSLFSAETATRTDSVDPKRNADAGSGTSARSAFSLAEAWRKEFKAAVTSSPRCRGGRIFFGCRDGYLYALDAGGTVIWKYRGAGGIGSSPACSENYVVCADYRGNLFRLDPGTGRRIWAVPLGSKVVSSAEVWQDKVFAGTSDGRLIAVSLADGRRLWARKIGPSIRANPAAGKDFVIVAASDGSLVRLDSKGKTAWSVKVGGGVYSNPLCLEDRDLIVFGSTNSYVCAYSLSAGTLRWKYRVGGEVNGSPAVRENALFIGAQNGNCYALTLDGKLLWQRDTGGAVLSTPLVIGNCLYVTTYGARLVALDAESGKTLGEYRAASPIFSSPDSDGKQIYFGSNGGTFYALDLPKEAT